jgi:hypothetical protein
MLNRRDIAMIAAASRQAGGGGYGRSERPRRGCLPGCTIPLILFILCGLPFDILAVLKVLGIAK